MKRTLLTSLLLVVMLQAMAQISMERIDVERLPDMNVPRTGHAAFWLNGELTVFGGHTNGFVPTPTAEYFRNGR